MSHKIRFVLLALGFLALVSPCRGDDKYRKTNTQNWDFVPAGQVELHFRYGDVHIVPGDDSHITLAYTMHSNNPDFSYKVEPQFEMKGTKAILTLKAPRNGSTDVELKLPARTDIYLRVFGGDIRLGRFDGNKDVETHGGDIDIEVSHLASYGPIDASTHAGDVDAAFGTPHGWIGKTLKYQGAGISNPRTHVCRGCQIPRGRCRSKRLRRDGRTIL